MKKDNQIVHGLWIGEQLSMLEMLTLKSFIAAGHEFNLWCYSPLKNELPEQVLLKDANEIIEEDRVFRYRNSNQFGHGKGSVSGFSDIFRYKLLYEKGGWWVDMDVTCLRPLDFDQPYYFRKHHELELVGNVMKAPKGCELMKRCYEEASRTVDSTNTDWHKPIQVLADHVSDLGLEGFIKEGDSIGDRWDHLKPFLYGTEPVPESFYYLHWMNEEWRNRSLDKYDFKIDSAYGRLLATNKLIEDDFTSFNRRKNAFRFLIKRVID